MVKNKKYIAKKTKKLLSNKWVLAATVVFFLGAGIYFISKNDKTPDTTTPPGGLTVSTGPATEQERTETEQHKEQLPSASSNASQSTNNTPTNNGQKKTVKPIITDTSNNSIKAYVSGVFEDGGTCTATFTKDGKILTKTSTGFENVSYTQCAPINFESGFLSAGKWSVAVKYSSATAEGVSDARSIDVQ